MDWNKIKAEYIAGGTSYRKLAEKHGVSFSTLRGIAEREKWTDLRTQAQHSADTKLVKTIGGMNGTCSVKINEVADKLLDKIIDMLNSEYIGSQSLRHLTSSLKDIKEIKGVKSELDLKEQNARIDKLRKEIEGEQKDTSITVTFGEDVKKYAN